MKNKGKFKRYLASLMAVIMITAMVPVHMAVSAEDSSKTYFVAVSGDDANSGTIDKPVKNASSLVSKLQPGDEVVYREGVYNGIVVLDNKGSSNEQPVVFKSYEGENVTLTSENGAYIYYIGHCQNIKIEGLTFNGRFGTAIDINQYEQGKQQTRDITVTNCKFIDCSHGVQVRDVIETGTDKKFGNLEISNNIFMASNHKEKYDTGIYLQECRAEDGCYAKFYNNVIINAQKSLKLWGRSENVLFYNNTMLDTYDQVGGSGEYDIYPVQGSYNKVNFPVDISYNCVFKNNIFSKPIRTQLEANSTLLEEDKNNVFENNVYDSSSLKDYVTYNYSGEGPKLTFDELKLYKTLGHEQNGLYTDIKFLDVEADARLNGSDNPAIKAAASEIVSGVSAPATDITGAKRANEAGAYAFKKELMFVGSYTGTADGSFNKPYSTIKDAVANGATQIQVKAGSYNEDGLAIPAGTTVTPYANSNVIVNGLVNVTGESERAVKISNILFKGNVAVNGEYVTLNGCTFNSGITADSVNNFTITNSKLTNCGNAITLNSTKNAVITNNLIKNNSVGVALNGTTESIIYNNTFYGNSKNDLSFDTSATNNSVKNNIFSAENVVTGANNFNYNCYNSDALTSKYLANISEPNSLKASPGFVNAKAGDYALYKLSACVKAGINDKNTPKKDINGISRGALCDIGAYCVEDSQSTYYVSTLGNDDNEGTRGKPFATISKAVQTMREGEKVTIMAGTYPENLVIEKTATGSAGFSLEAQDGDTVTINGSVTVKNSKNVTFKGIEVTGDLENKITIDNCQNITVDNVSVSGSTTGVKVASSKNITFSALTVTESTKGISINSSTVNMTRSKIKSADKAVELTNKSNLALTASVILNCKEGIVSKDESALNVINNTFYNNSGKSIDVIQTVKDTTLNIYNNIFARESRVNSPFVSINKSAGFNTENNLYDADEDMIISVICNDPRTLAKLKVGDDDTCSILGNPLFKDANIENFAPTKKSPITRKGHQSADSPKKDFIGKDFVKTLDIGAYYSPYTMETYNVAPYGIGWSQSGGADGIDTPFASLKEAVNIMNSSDTIIMHKGIYWDLHRQDLANICGVDDAKCTIKGCDDPNCEFCKLYDTMDSFKSWPRVDRATFCGDGVWPHYDKTKESKDELCMKLVDCKYLTIENIDIAGYTDAGIWVYGGDNVELKNMNIFNIDHKEQSNSGVQGVLVNNATNCTFKDLNIWDIGYTRKSQADHGMYVGHASNCVFENIVVYQSPGAGIQLYAGDNYNIHAENNKIQNCIFSNCLNGLIVCGNQGLQAINNTFHNSRQNDLYLDWNNTDCNFQNNLFYNDLKLTDSDGSIIARHNGHNDNRVTGNTFTNCIYDYSQQQPMAVEGWGNKTPINDFIDAQTSANFNTFTSFEKGKARFDCGIIDEKLSVADQVKQIRNGVFQTLKVSDTVDAGLPINAPQFDFNGAKRVGNPDIGAYEAKDMKIVSLSVDSINENNEKGATIGELSILGEEPTTSARYELVVGEGSEDNQSFIINGNALTAINSFDYEAKSSYKIRVKATLSTGTVMEKALVVTIENVEENPVAEDTINIIKDNSVTVDGIINEDVWTNSFKDLTIGLDKSSEFRAKMAFTADSNNLYVAADIKDNEISNDLVTGVDFNSDMIELYIDGLNLETPNYDESTVQFQFRYNDNKVYVFGNDKKFENVAFKIVEKDGGYCFEASIAWGDLGVTFNKENTIGIAADVQDYDKNGDGGKLKTVDGSDFWKDKSAFKTYGFKELMKPDDNKVFNDSKTGVNLSVPTEILELIGGNPTFEVEDTTIATDAQINVGSTSYNTLKAYKIDMSDMGGNEITLVPNGRSIKVKIPFVGEANHSYVVIRDGATVINATYNSVEKTIEFVTNHFSEFVIATKVNTTSSTTPTHFEFSQYQITATAGEGGTITPNGAIMIDKYSDQTYEANPKDGYKVDKVIIDGTNEVSLTDGKYVFHNVNEPYTIHVTFVKIQNQTLTKPDKIIAKPNKNSNKIATKVPQTGDTSIMYVLAIKYALLSALALALVAVFINPKFKCLIKIK